MSATPSDFVKQAFSEGGGSQLQLLATLLDRNDLDPSMTADEKFHVLCSEVLKLKSQIATLQSNVQELSQERDKMTLLIWNELSRLASKVDGNEIAANSPLRQVVDKNGKVNDPVLKALLAGCSSQQSSEGDATPTISLEATRASKRLRTSLEADTAGRSPRRVDRVSSGTDEDGHAASERRITAESACEQSSLIQQWMTKQCAGMVKRAALAKPAADWDEGDWWCFVCNNLAKDGPPGDHFCWSRFESDKREGIKVYCQYCRKGTARMPDLRVHFKKIVYCRVLREGLRRAWLERGPSLLLAAEEEQQQQPEDSSEHDIQSPLLTTAAGSVESVDPSSVPPPNSGEWNVQSNTMVDDPTAAVSPSRNEDTDEDNE